MGWYFSHREKGQTTIDYLVDDGALVREKVKASSTQNGVCYVAYEFEPGRTAAFVFLTQWAGGYHNFGYKPMEESMGPNEATAPRKVLDALSPLEDLFTPGSDLFKWAAQWRAACQAYNDKPRPRKGDVVVFDKPLEFTNGDKLDTFIYEKGSVFRGADGFGRYTITKYKDRGFEVVR